MSETTCQACERTTRDDAYLCDHCVEEFDKALGDVTWLDTELETTITRQRGAATNGGSRSATTPLPWHERASAAQRDLHALLVSWVRFCVAEGVRGLPTWEPADRLPSLARWMLHATRGLALHELGPDAFAELTDAVASCRSVVFWKRKSRVYLGKCEQVVRDPETDDVILACCPGDVYAEEGEQVGHCEECEQGVTVVIRQAEINKRLEDKLFTAAEAATAATYLGLHADRDRIRKRINQWHTRGRVLPARREGDDVWFRYADLRPLLFAEFGDTA